LPRWSEAAALAHFSVVHNLRTVIKFKAGWNIYWRLLRLSQLPVLSLSHQSPQLQQPGTGNMKSQPIKRRRLSVAPGANQENLITGRGMFAKTAPSRSGTPVRSVTPVHSMHEATPNGLPAGVSSTMNRRASRVSISGPASACAPVNSIRQATPSDLSAVSSTENRRASSVSVSRPTPASAPVNSPKLRSNPATPKVIGIKPRSSSPKIISVKPRSIPSAMVKGVKRSASSPLSKSSVMAADLSSSPAEKTPTRNSDQATTPTSQQDSSKKQKTADDKNGETPTIAAELTIRVGSTSTTVQLQPALMNKIASISMSTNTGEATPVGSTDSPSPAKPRFMAKKTSIPGWSPPQAPQAVFCSKLKNFPTDVIPSSKTWNMIYGPDFTLLEGCYPFMLPIVASWGPKVDTTVRSKLKDILSAHVAIAFITARDNDDDSQVVGMQIRTRDGGAPETSYARLVLRDYWFCLLKWANTMATFHHTEASGPSLDSFIADYFKKQFESNVARMTSFVDYADFAQLLSTIARYDAEKGFWVEIDTQK
ncbi:hypothetical protein QBC35DRAFT_551088, partial [Podospora australis]